MALETLCQEFGGTDQADIRRFLAGSEGSTVKRRLYPTTSLMDI